MANSRILGGSTAPEEIIGKDVHALGPSDNSDSGSDAVGAYGEDELSTDSDAAGTGERAAAGNGLGLDPTDTDRLPKHIEMASGMNADTDVVGNAGDDLDDLSEVEERVDEGADPNLDAELEAKDSDEGASGSR